MEKANFGTCCACGTSENVSSVVLLDKRSPYGHGWGCFLCGLSQDGAIAVVCEKCADEGVPLREFVRGEVANGERASYEELTTAPPFEHDPAFHPELQEDPVVLVDENTGEQITDSQLREICENAKRQAREGNLPPYWKNEASGILQPAVIALIEHGANPQTYAPPTPQQVGLIKQYFALYINAPCWRVTEELAALREAVQGLQTVEDLDRWLNQAIQEGIDPL